MAEYKIIKIKFNRRPLHLSDGRGLYYKSEGVLHSDTLKNAVFTSLLKLRSLSSQEIKDFYESFFFSSALPYFRDELFFPRPLGYFQTDSHDIKAVKKIRYIGKSLFEKWLETGHFSQARTVAFNKGQFISADLRRKIKESEEIIYRQVQERVRIKRLRNGDSEPYFMEQIRFAEDAGLYFFVKHAKDASDEHKTWLKQGLNLLADEGLGSDKTYGFGQFDLIKSDDDDVYLHRVDLKTPQDADAWYAAGLYTPSESEIKDLAWLKKSRYAVTERGGYIANPEDKSYRSFRRNTGRFMQVGSVISGNKTPTGQCLNLKPKKMTGHDVWRDGRTVFLPVKINAHV